MRRTEKKPCANEMTAGITGLWRYQKIKKIKKNLIRRSPHRWAFGRGGVPNYIPAGVFVLCGKYKRNKDNTKIWINVII